MAAPQQYSGKGFILGGVTDTTPDWLGSYNEGYDAAQQQKTTALNQQEARQRMGLAAAEEQRIATKFADEQADRARTEAYWSGQGGLPGLQTPQGPALGPMPALEIPMPKAPSPGLMEQGATTPAPGAITSDQRMQMLPEWARLEQAEGLPNNYLETISMLESSGGTNVGTGQYTGIFQIGPEVAADFGVTPERLRDPRVNAAVAAMLAGRNAAALRGALGRQPQPWELYLAHQQGLGGATALLRAPGAKAVDVLASAYGGDRNAAAQAITQNGGNINMTAGEFASLWAQKFGGALPQPFTGGPGAQGAGEAPPEMVSTPSPTASPLRNDINEFLAKRNRREVYYNIINDLRESPLRGAYDYLFSDQATAERNAEKSATRAEALQWYQLDEVGNFFNANPAALVEAQRDPIRYFEQNSDAILGAAAEEGAKGDLPAGVTLPGAAPAAGAPAAPAAPAVTPGLQTQPMVPTGEVMPPVTREDYAGVVQPGQGSIAQQIMRTPTGQVPTIPDMGPYMIEPAAIKAEMDELMFQRQTMERLYADAVQARDRATMVTIQTKAAELDAGIRLMQNMQAVASMQAGDDTQVAQTLSRLSSGQLRLQPRSDGKYNIFQNGKLAYEGVTKDALIASLRMEFDQQFQAQVAARATATAERGQKVFESELKTAEEIAKQEAEAYKQIAVDRQKEILRVQLQQANPERTAVEGSDGRIYMYDKNGRAPPVVFEMQPELDVYGDPLMRGDMPVMKLVQVGASNAVPIQ
jgi:hypothetical protein